MIGRNDPCFCGSGKKWKKCHYPKPPPSSLSSKYAQQYGIALKSEKQIDKIRKASQFSARLLEEACAMAKAGVTTAEIDEMVAARHKEANAIPAALHYGSPPFPKGICTSLNEVVCHGIPNETPLIEGDIMNIDIASILDGYYGDCSAMVKIGKVSEERELVVKTAYDCLMESIKILKPGVLVSEIGEVITSLAEKRGCSVVYQFVGHGVGAQFHEPPQVPHNRNETHIPLAPGMTFTIEPMINAGVAEAVIDPITQWIATTRDGKASAQWEHTVLITETGYEILTLP